MVLDPTDEPVGASPIIPPDPDVLDQTLELPDQEQEPDVPVRELDRLYGQYQQDPSPQNLNLVVKQLSPTIEYNLAARQIQNPALRTRARVIAAEAVQKYDPAGGAALPSWVSQQLQRLNREARQSTSGYRLPDRIYTDAMTIRRAEQEFLAKHDREPDADELADLTNLTPARLTSVRSQLRRVVGAGAFDPDTLRSGLRDQQDPTIDEALDYVYHDSDRTDKQILEMLTGYGGKYEPTRPGQIAKQMRIDPSHVSRRTSRLVLRIEKLRKDIEREYGGGDAS